MKKSLLISFFLGIIMIFAFAINACASSNIMVYVNGDQLTFDTQPNIENGTTLVPMRAIFESLGATVNWNPGTQTAVGTKDNTNVQLKLNSYSGIVNGQKFSLALPAKSINGRIMVPLRFISESFECKVNWNSATKTITINTGVSGSPLTVHFIDVGQADCILIKTGSHAMLIDGGNNADEQLIINYLKSQNVSSLDYIIATHPHEDHIGGLDGIINGFDVKKVIMSNAITTTQTYENLLDAIENNALSITAAKYGNKYDLGTSSFTILAPISSSYEDLNNYSVVLKLTNGSDSFLFTGDAEADSEQEMLSSNLSSDVLKVGHHGSNSSTSQSFLNAVNPSYAIISVGKDNTYGHPAQLIIDQLLNRNIKIYRTDLQGTVIATSSGNGITFNTAATQQNNNFTNTEQEKIGTATQGIIISNIDKKAEIVTIKNTMAIDVNLKGWKLISVTGNQAYIFPQYTLKSGASVTVASAGATGILIWDTGNVWNNSSYDPGILYDANGNLVYEFVD